MILAFSAWFGLAASAGAALLYGVLALASQRMSTSASRGLLLAAWLLHALALAEGLLGQPPRFGFAPALSTTVWLVVTVYAVESKLIPELKARWALAAVGAAAVLLRWCFRVPATTVLPPPGCRCTGRWALRLTACLARLCFTAG